MQQQQTISQLGLWPAMKSELYTTTSNDQLTGWTEKLQSTSQSQTCTKKRSWSLFTAAGLIHCSFLNPGETIIFEKYAQQINEITKNCSRYRSTERAQFFSTTTSDQRSHNQKLKELGYEVLPHPVYSPDLGQPTTTSSSILTTFLHEIHIHNQQDAENAFQEFVEFWSIDFYATGISKLISSWQNCVDCKAACFD